MENTMPKTIIYLDGIDGSGKTTLKNNLTAKHSELDIRDRGILSTLSLLHWDNWGKPEDLKRQWDHYIILETDIPEARKRLLKRQEKEDIKLDEWESEENLFLFRYRFRTLAAHFGNIHLIDTTSLTLEQVQSIVEEIILNKNKNYLVPSIENFTQEEFDNLPHVIEGESKIVKEYNHRFHIVKYKPTVYSHKMQRAGEVPGTDKERMIMTKQLLDVFSRHMIKHSYWSVGSNFILNEKLDNEKDIPCLEIIVKRCFVGSDKHRYYNMNNIKNRFGQDVVKKSDKNEYQKLLVRFDFRNPNFHPETGVPIGDILVCDDLADEFIDVSVAKPTALKIFRCLDQHFSKMSIYFEDVCLMLTVSGDKLYGEVSQDCGRYKYIHENELSDLDKDVWRAGGSSELVLQKYQMLSKLVSKYVKDTLYEEEKLIYS